MSRRLKKFLLFIVFVIHASNLFSQGFPWERPLKMAWSNDGVTFNLPVIFQDSSGVPSVVRWNGDTLVCAFQWFRVPVNSPSWDRVAVKFSYDNGLSWTQPTPIVVNGLPVNYQRPFDPALLRLNTDSIRIYFSSSDGMPNGGLDSMVNTYSAVSTDGINYSFDPAARVDEPNNRVIDPSVIFFHNTFHYEAPVGSPQQGAYHYISPNGLNFTKVQNIPSDSNHNWTGNYMVKDTTELRFYGAGPNGIWYNSTPNGGIWNGYVNTNIQGGDPTVVRIGSSSYLMIFVGNPYSTGLHPVEASKDDFKIFPNPASGKITIEIPAMQIGEIISIYSARGNHVLSQKCYSSRTEIDIGSLSQGMYFISTGIGQGKMFQLTK